MRRDTKTDAADFFTFARDYLRTYMPTIRHLSPRTIEAYRISLESFLTFLAAHEHIGRATVNFDHFDRARLKAWLIWLADDKHYATRTVTLRLSAIKAFLAYAAAGHRLDDPMARLKEWMERNNASMLAAILGLIGVMVLYHGVHALSR